MSTTDGHKPYYRLTTKEVLDQLRTTASGLSKSEAADRRHYLGENQLASHLLSADRQLFLSRLKNPLVWTLVVAAGLAVYAHEAGTAAFLILVAFLNIGVSLAQERASRQLAPALAKLVPERAQVLRHDHGQTIASRLLVPGDIICLEVGDRVPADARVLTEEKLATDDSMLTGASQPTPKFAHALSAEVSLKDQNNMIYLGTAVLAGSCRAVVTGTGMNTELGRLAGISQAPETTASPLQHEMNKLAVRTLQGVLLLAAIATLIGLQTNLGTTTTLLFIISFVAIAPAGLQIEAGLILAQAAGWLTRIGGSASKLSTLDTLSATTVMLADATGLLTAGELTVHHILIGKARYTVTGNGYAMNGIVQDAKGKPLTGVELKNLHLFFQAAALSGTATLQPPDKDHSAWYVSGNPAEGALITLARKAGIETDGLNERFSEQKVFVFDAARQRKSSLCKVDDQLYAFVQGTPEAILNTSSEIWDHGHTRKLTSRDRQYILRYHQEQTALGKYTAACAYRVLPANFDSATRQAEDVEKELIFLGVCVMDDPLAETTPAALADLRQAHVHLSIITSLAAVAATLAREAGSSPDRALPTVSGSELSQLNDNQVVELLLHEGAVFYDISPADKLRLVRVAKQSRQVVTITGHSLQEAAALRQADVGLITESPTARGKLQEAADLVLPQDNQPATLVSALARGRLGYQHIKTAAASALADSASAVWLVLISLVAAAAWGIPAAITAIQILVVGVVTQLFPSSALGGDPAESRLMHAVPRHRHEHLLDQITFRRHAITGLLAAGLAYTNYLLFFARHHLSPVMSPDAAPYLQATTLTCLTLVFCQFINLLLARLPEHKPFFSRAQWSNGKLLIGFALSLLCIGVIIYDPSARTFFASGPLTVWDCSMATLAALLYACVRLFHHHTRRYGHRQLFATHHPAKIQAHLHKSSLQS